MNSALKISNFKIKFDGAVQMTAWFDIEFDPIFRVFDVRNKQPIDLELSSPVTVYHKDAEWLLCTIKMWSGQSVQFLELLLSTTSTY